VKKIQAKKCGINTPKLRVNQLKPIHLLHLVMKEIKRHSSTKTMLCNHSWSTLHHGMKYNIATKDTCQSVFSDTVLTPCPKFD